MNIFEKGLTKYLSGQEICKIKRIRIGIGGAGGLGSNIALILCRCGFSKFEILDKDVIEPSNLNRQQYYIDEISKNKVDILKEHILRINPNAYVMTHKKKWDKDNAHLFFKKCTVIVEAFDNADYKHDFVEYYQDKTGLLVSGNGLAGITLENNIKVKEISNLYVVGDNKSNAEDGLPPMAPRVIICAATMANIILSKTLSIK